MRELLLTAERVVDHDVSLLLLGESGSGKDYLAEAIHACGKRRDRPMIRIDCASIPADLFESELFGYEKGTFTDAQTRKLGKLELAAGGSVYFDDISSLASPLQAKLLRAIQEKQFQRLGGHTTIPFDARVITSSSMDPNALLAGGGLRRDLFYRINVVTLTVPPLRERPQDIKPLALKFLNRRKKGIDDAAMRMLLTHSWPGNVRELRNAIDRAVVVETSERITPASLPPLASDPVETASSGQWTLEQLEERYIREVLRKTRFHYSKAASILGINRKTLLEKRRRHGID